MKVEKRSFEVRAESGNDFCIVGYAALFNSPSKDLGGFCEVLLPSVFNRSLASGADVQFTFNHSQDAVLARVSNQTLQLATDKKGLKFRALLNKGIQQHRDLYEACRSGLYNECSFAFTVADGGERWDNSGPVPTRYLSDVNLMDTSLVGTPAYNGTSAAARNLGSSAYSAQEVSDLLAKAEAMPQDWANQERAHAIAMQLVEKRKADDYDEDGTPSARDIESFLAARFGKSRAGHASKYALIEHEVSAMPGGGAEGVAICMDNDAPVLSRVRIRFVIDPYGKVTVSEPEDERKYLASLQIA